MAFPGCTWTNDFKLIKITFDDLKSKLKEVLFALEKDAEKQVLRLIDWLRSWIKKLYVDANGFCDHAT